MSLVLTSGTNGGGGAAAVMLLLLELALCVFFIFCMWKIFEKAGEEGWKCLIPVYNTYIMFKIATGNGWKMLFMLIPFFNFVYSIMFMFKLAKVFGKGTGFGFGLLFLPYVFIPILALGDAEYEGVE